MKTMKALTQIAICGLVLLVSAGGMFAQEPPPPPPSPAHMGQTFSFFTRIEESSMNKLVTGAPYSAQAITETTQTLADGNQIHQQTTANLYRDSQGRTRREQTLGNMGPWSSSETTPHQIIFINDPVARVNYVLNPDEHVAHKMTPLQERVGLMTMGKNGAASGAPASPGADPAFLAEPVMAGPPPGGPPDIALSGGARTMTMNKEFFWEGWKGEPGTAESLGTQTMEGVQATGTRTTYTIPAGQIGNEQPIQMVTERWYSPALQTVVMSKRSDPRVGVTTYRLTNITLAEPSPDLFQVPAEYTVTDSPGVINSKALPPPGRNQ